jgi:uncharacterized phage infection (PIP) family protein YhgE
MLQIESLIISAAIIISGLLISFRLSGIINHIKLLGNTLKETRQAIKEIVGQVNLFLEQSKQIITSFNSMSNSILRSSEVITDLSLKVSQQNQTLQEIREKFDDIKSAIPSLDGVQNASKETGDKIVQTLMDGFVKIEQSNQFVVTNISNEIKQGTRHIAEVSEEINKTLSTMQNPLKDELINLRKTIETDVNPLTSLEG